MNKKDALNKIFAAGVVGAGGAGFPAWKKLDTRVEYLLANGAECEPLLFKDRETMLQQGDLLIRGLQLMQALTDAEHVIIGIKQKNIDIIDVLKPQADKNGFTFLVMKDVYPAGDEYVLVYEATGRQIPPGGIPLDIGCVVNNTETIINVANAVFNDTPVVEKYLTINGAVANPITTTVPVGTSFADCIDLAGGFTVDNPVIFTGGIMMGGVETDFTLPVSKLNGGLIVLPEDHYLVRRKTASTKSYTAIGHSACDQCSMCTEMCPRYLLGYPIQPHRVMRTMQLTGENKDRVSLWAEYCCECNICSLFACPEGLDPKSICVDNKKHMHEQNIQWDPEILAENFLEPHPARKGREIPIRQLVLRLGLLELDKKAPFIKNNITPGKVRLPLRQHIGVPAEPVVSVSDMVKTGDLIANIPDGALGAPVHASINGKVTAVTADEIIIENN